MKNDEINNSVTKALSHAAHDMRNPLQVISGTAELMILQAKEGDDCSGAKQILQQSEYLTQIIDDLVGFERMSNIGDEAKSFTEMLQLLESQLVETAKAEKVQLEFPQFENVQFSQKKIHKISRILLNLMNNSVSSSYEGVVSLDVQIDADQLILRVSDTGRGINFDPKTDNIEQILPKRGLGVGIVCEMVQSLYGSVYWENSPRSLCTVQIPI